VSAVIVSNHGGRQLDHVPATLEVLPEIVDAVDGRADVILDGGVRRGTDVVKALALGARACMIGRPYLYGLGAGGEPGVARALELLRAEMQRAMMLVGCRSVRELDSGYLRRRGAQRH
jgi:isopentenyl diphosphate isomerase/L-lactate dehydrogenase-like FMN-dependent dehydrogenase